MLSVEAMVFRDFHGKRAPRIGVRRAGDAATVQLAPSCGDADLLGQAGAGGRTQFGTDEPDGLCQESQKQESGEKLGATEPFACEKSGH